MTSESSSCGLGCRAARGTRNLRHRDGVTECATGSGRGAARDTGNTSSSAARHFSTRLGCLRPVNRFPNLRCSETVLQGEGLRLSPGRGRASVESRPGPEPGAGGGQPVPIPGPSRWHGPARPGPACAMTCRVTASQWPRRGNVTRARGRHGDHRHAGSTGGAPVWPHPNVSTALFGVTVCRCHGAWPGAPTEVCQGPQPWLWALQRSEARVVSRRCGFKPSLNVLGFDKSKILV